MGTAARGCASPRAAGTTIPVTHPPVTHRRAFSSRARKRPRSSPRTIGCPRRRSRTSASSRCAPRTTPFLPGVPRVSGQIPTIRPRGGSFPAGRPRPSRRRRNADEVNADCKRLETTGNRNGTDPPFAAARGAGVAIALRGTSSGVVRVLCADTRTRDSPLSVADLAAAHETATQLAAIYAADAERVRAWTRAVIRARWSELDNGDDEGDDDKENAGTLATTRGDYRFDTPAGGGAGPVRARRAQADARVVVPR